MNEPRLKAVQMVSQDEIFRAVAYAALKARAGRFMSGEIIKIGRFELVVAEDENGEGIVVQIIETLSQIEALALARAQELGMATECWSDHEKREWMTYFYSDLAKILRQWQNIEMRHGPGENLTFEKAIYK
jgi:hypothetical protein